MNDAPVPDAHGWLTLPAAGEDRFTALAFDFGWNHMAYTRIEIEGACGGEIVDSIYAVSRDSETNEPEPLTGFGQDYEGVADRFIASADVSCWEACLPRGYRYHAVVVRSDKPLRIRVSAVRTHHAAEALPFRCSDSTVEQMWNVSERTLRATLLDTFTDCNHREQVSWMHDAGCYPAMGAWATYGDFAMLRRALDLWSQSQNESGVLDGCAPAEHCFARMPDETVSWLELLAFYYRATADEAFVRTMLPVVDRIVAYLSANLTVEGIFIPPEGDWIHMDWSPLTRSPYSLTLNLIILSGIRETLDLARAMGADDLVESCRKIDQQITEAAKSFWSSSENAWL